MPLRLMHSDTAVTSTISMAGLAAWWSCQAWAQSPGPEVTPMSMAMPQDVAVMVELVRLLGAPGIALALGWALARWRPVLTLVVRHDIPEGSRLEVVALDRRPAAASPRDPEEDTGTIRLRREREDRG